jgi:hypothetical protein
MVEAEPIFAFAKAPSCDDGHFVSLARRVLLRVDDGLALRRFAMATSLKKAGARFRRWFKALQEKNRPPYRWYEHGYYDA